MRVVLAVAVLPLVLSENSPVSVGDEKLTRSRVHAGREVLRVDVDVIGLVADRHGPGRLVTEDVGAGHDRARCVDDVHRDGAIEDE